MRQNEISYLNGKDGFWQRNENTRVTDWVRYELQFCDDTGRVYRAFPCNEIGTVDRDGISYNDRINLQNCYKDSRLHSVINKEVEFMRYNYAEEVKQGASIQGISCEFFDVRLELKTIPDGRFYYEIGHNGSGDPCRIQRGIAVDFFGSLVCNQPLPLGEDHALWLEPNDFVIV